jgi:hypothetical protein
MLSWMMWICDNMENWLWNVVYFFVEVLFKDNLTFFLFHLSIEWEGKNLLFFYVWKCSKALKKMWNSRFNKACDAKESSKRAPFLSLLHLHYNTLYFSSSKCWLFFSLAVNISHTNSFKKSWEFWCTKFSWCLWYKWE